MDNFEYKKYSLENLEKWIEDAINSSEASPQEIYDVIKNVVADNYYCYKNHTERCYELLALLNGNGNFSLSDVLKEREYYEGTGHKLVCDKDDKSPECQNAWNDFWEENYYPEEHQKHTEEVKDDGMRPWGHSDLEYMIANPTLTEDRVSNFPGEQYTEEELNAMCDSAKKEDKVVKWQLPVQVDGLSGECFVEFPDDLLEAANLKENDLVSWIDRKDGSFELRKVTKPIGMEEC
jgi:hypothetical protein